MKYVKLPNTDMDMSVLTLGTWVFSGDVWGAVKEQECRDAVAAAADCGINVIDTAPIYGYGAAEIIVGKAVRGCRGRFLIATKCGLIGRGREIRHDLSPGSIRREVEDSLRRLGVERIDLYQCHWPDPDTAIESTMEALRGLQQQGKIRYIGVSNFDQALLERARRCACIVTSQNPGSILDRSGETLFRFCQERQIGVLTYGSLAGGILTGKYDQAPRFKSGDARSFFYKYYSPKHFEPTRQLLEKLRSLGQPLNQIALNWARRQPGVVSVLCGCRNAAQVRDNAAAIAWDLSEEQTRLIDEWAKQTLDPGAANL
ncbi:MAG: aldo/keto reductase [Candidatus Omnitrophica bacterium]|nr:aldo/keto reductase [Candidatus Omnitrophota bacterium]